MIQKHFLFFVFLVIRYTVCLSQQDKKIDSLLTVLQNLKSDTVKVNTLNALSKQFVVIKNLADAKRYAEEALSLAEKKSFTRGVQEAQINSGKISNTQGMIFIGQGNYPEALKHFFTALKIFEKYKSLDGIAGIHLNIGHVYSVQRNFAEALKYFFASLKIFEELNDKNGIAGVYNNIGLVYENQGNYQEALKYYYDAIKMYNEAGNKRALIDRYFNIGFLYEDQGNYPEALKNHSAALKISEEIGSKNGMAASNSNIGGVYNNQGNYSKALNSYLLALKLYQETENREGVGISYTNIGAVYLDLKNFHLAKQYLGDALSIATDVESIEGKKIVYELMIKLDSATGNWQEALLHHKLFILYRDSLSSEEVTNRITKAQMQYDFDRKEDSLNYQQSLTDEKLKQQTLLTRQQKQLKNYLLAGFILFVVLSFFIYRNYRTRQQLKLQTLRNKIASDLHDDVGSTLSSISIFSQMAQQQSKEVIPMLETIGESSRKMLDAMADIVWTINPENDQFEKIILRMKRFAFELLGAKKIDFEFVADDEVAKMKLPMDVRKNLYLIFKEATNNMVKYAGASKAMFAIKEEKNNLTMLIRDNGKGFDTSQSTEGNGLKNMKKRADEIRAQLTIESVSR